MKHFLLTNCRRVAAALHGVRPTVKHPAILICMSLALAACVGVRAPGMAGAVWSGQDGHRLSAELRIASAQLPEGWLFKAPQGTGLGSFAYRKRSGSYDFSENDYFAVDAHWRNDQTYVGLLKQDGVFCVVNPEMQGDIAGDTVTTYRAYDYCVQLRRQ